MDVQLSICIPTYNFGKFIGETLASMVPQVVPGVEIDILDGGSTDDTADIVAEWQRRCPAIRYHRMAARGGIDRDMAKVVALSRGRYFWLFSADDIMFDGSIARILDEIDRDLDVYLCAHQEWKFDLTLQRERHPSLMIDVDETFNLSIEIDRRRYFDHAYTTAAFFSYLGALVVRRTTWDREKLDERYIGSCWAHAVRLLILMKSGMRLRYVAKPMLAWRADNDSFAGSGLVNRCALAVEGYHKIAATVFGAQSFEAAAIRRVVTNEYTLGYFLAAKRRIANAPRQERKRLDALASLAFADPSRKNSIRRWVYRLFPTMLVPAIRLVWRGIRPWATPLLEMLDRRRIARVRSLERIGHRPS